MQYLELAEELYEKLTRGNGRRVYSIEDLINEKG